LFGSLLGTSPVIIHNETCAGIQDGARTGLTAVVVSLCFIITVPLIPILKAIPDIATAPPLILVGMFMMQHAKFIDWSRLEEAFPAFMTVTLIPLSYSIAVGMVFGLVSYMLLRILSVFSQIILGRHPVEPKSDHTQDRTDYENIPNPIP